MKRIACACGREMAIMNGVAIRDVIALGWRRQSMMLSGAEIWICPSCRGDTSAIRRVFEKTS